MEDLTAIDAALDYGHSTAGHPDSLPWMLLAIALLILFQLCLTKTDKPIAPPRKREP